MKKFDFLKTKADLVSLPKGASDDEIKNAEIALSLKFSDDYKAYTKRFGALSFEGHEFTGVVKSKRLDVVENTLSKRKLFADLPSNYYVIENLGIDGMTIFQNEAGSIYLYSKGCKNKKIANSLDEYFNSGNLQ